VVGLCLRHRASKSIRTKRLIDVGNLSDSWLAEQRAQRNANDWTETSD
jgi:hypothetical protein